MTLGKLLALSELRFQHLQNREESSLSASQSLVGGRGVVALSKLVGASGGPWQCARSLPKSRFHQSHQSCPSLDGVVKSEAGYKLLSGGHEIRLAR